ncbi:PKD domain-containing protein [Kocuria varians]
MSQSIQAWNPDTDPDYQKALRNALMSNDDSIFFNAQLMDTAKNRTTYGLQDPCIDDKGAALSRCRSAQECTDDSGAKGVNMDIVVGGANEGARSARGTQMCVGQAQAEDANDDGYVPLPVFTLQDFQQLAVAPAENHAQPAPDTLKNMNTNVYAVAQPQTFETTLGGYPVSVRAYPVQYTWNYGDGTTLGPTPLTGSPLADGAWDVPTDISHVYTRTGDFQITLTTSFYGEYNIAGTGWQPVNGYNQVTSPPVALSVWRSTVHNVADDCRVNPSGIGCPGAKNG